MINIFYWNYCLHLPKTTDVRNTAEKRIYIFLIRNSKLECIGYYLFCLQTVILRQNREFRKNTFDSYARSTAAPKQIWRTPGPHCADSKLFFIAEINIFGSFTIVIISSKSSSHNLVIYCLLTISKLTYFLRCAHSFEIQIYPTFQMQMNLKHSDVRSGILSKNICTRKNLCQIHYLRGSCLDRSGVRTRVSSLYHSYCLVRRAWMQMAFTCIISFRNFLSFLYLSIFRLSDWI